MSVLHGAIAHNDVLAGDVPMTSVVVLARFDGDAIVARIEDAILYQHILARFGVASVVVGPMAIEGVSAHHNVLREQGVKNPEGRVVEGDALNQHAVALIYLDELWAELIFDGEDSFGQRHLVGFAILQFFFSHKEALLLVFGRCAGSQLPPVLP